MPPMRRKKGGKVNNTPAKLATIDQKERKDASTKNRFQTLLMVFVSVLAARWLLSPTKNGIPKSDISDAFDDFYEANVQPLLDRGLRSFNGTQHALEESARVGHQLRKQK